MKHLPVPVDNLDRLISLGSTLFAAQPGVVKPDDTRWMSHDQWVHVPMFATSAPIGVDHPGIQMEAPRKPREVHGRLRPLNRLAQQAGAATCCHASSEKTSITDPQGRSRMTVLTTGASALDGDSAEPDPIRTTKTAACCTPETPQGMCCAPKPELTRDAPCCGPAADR